MKRTCDTMNSKVASAMKLLLLFSLLFIIRFSNAQQVNELPLLVWNSPNQPYAAYSSPVIFYTPHQDDETLGMGSSIAANVREGKPVYVVLFANGGGSSALNILNGESFCWQHMTTHHFNLSKKDFINARNAEFIAACKALGVHRIYIANNGAGWDESIGLGKMTAKFKDLVLFFHAQFPKASHNFISGNCDVNPHEDRQNAHRAGAIAIHQLYNAKTITDIQLHKVYVYYFPSKQRTSNWEVPVSYPDMLTRQKACDQYGYFNPAEGRYAIAYLHSVVDLFINSLLSGYDYVDYTQNDCQ